MHTTKPIKNQTILKLVILINMQLQFQVHITSYEQFLFFMILSTKYMKEVQSIEVSLLILLSLCFISKLN